MISIPIFYFPTTIVCVDDDPLMLQALKLVIDQNFEIKTYTRSAEALEYFNNNYTSTLSKQLLTSLTDHEYYDAVSHAPVNLKISDIFNLSLQIALKSEVSILIADYYMPEIDGISFCKKINTSFFKKVLLTGSHDYETAIQAFNDKSIDFYIDKSSTELVDKLKSSIKVLSTNFFNDITANLKRHLEVDYELPISDPVFINFFNETIDKYSIKEYYLIDKNGSFLLINNFNQKMKLIIHTDKSLDTFVDYYNDDSYALNHIESIKKRELIPFFGVGISSENIDPTNWEHYLYSPQKILGKENYYWHLLE